MTRPLGPFQVAVLNAIRTRPDMAYAGGITHEVGKMTARRVDDGQVTLALHRMLANGLVAKITPPGGPPLKLGRGRPRQYYCVTEAGEAALQDAARYTGADT